MTEEKTVEIVETMFHVFRLIKDEMSGFDNLMHLSIMQIRALIFINKNKKTTMSDIAEYFHIELPSATSLLNKLHEKKLVERHEDKVDRRLVIVTLTTEGKVLVKTAMRERRKKMEKVLSYLSEKEQTELLAILKTLNNRLQK